MESGTFRKVTRSILRNKSFLLFNILGLAIGILCLIYSSLYIVHETKVDRYNSNYNRIYRVIQKSNTSMLGSSPFVLKPLLGNIPEIENSARFIKSNIAIKKNDEFIVESNLKYVDKEIFQIFTIPVIYGNVNNFLNEPNSIILTKDISEKYFGQTNPVGEILTTRVDGKDYDLRVVIALPFAYYVIKKLLNQFLVQVPFNFGSYFITLISTCLFVFIILVLRTVFVLRQNLVQHLKSE